MSSKYFAAAVLVAIGLPLHAGAAPLSLDAALDLALQRSEASRAARAAALSATESSRAAGQLPDPTLRVGIDNLPVTGRDRLSTTRDSMTMKRIGIGQEWLSGAKRAARQAEADAMTARENVRVLVADAETRVQTALAFVDAYYAAQTLQFTTQTERLAGEEFDAARARLASSVAGSQEVLGLVGARGAAEDESAEMRQQQGAARVALERWVGPTADVLASMDPPVTPSEAMFIASHPAVVVSQREVELARAVANVTSTNRSPNWSWEASYGQRTGYSDMVSVGVSIPLPVAPDARQDRETAAKLALVDRAEADLTEATRVASAEYRTLTSDAKHLAERMDRYRIGVLKPAQQRTAAALAAYRSNAGALLPVFEARRAEVEAQKKVLLLERDLTRAQVQLHYKSIGWGTTP